MYYNDYFRSEDPQEFNNLNDIYETEAMNAPFYCPYYRQFSPPQRPPQQQPPFGQPGGGQQGGRPPSGPPPSVTPSKQSPMVQSAHGTFAVESQTLRPCLFRFVYIWPRRGRGFWAWLTFVGRRSVSGFRWDGRRWLRFGMDLRQIESFICY